MKTKVTSSLCFLALLACVSPAAAALADGAPELQGILVTGKERRFALVTPGGATMAWVGVGQTFEGWTLESHRAADDAIVLNRDGRRVVLVLRPATVSEGEAVAPARATVGEADAMLTKMKFEAMWESIADEQRKAMVGVFRQQMSAELTRHGLTPAEIDALSEKMGDAAVAGLQSDQMRQDFARIYAEVYTKEELRGMAEFYDTTAGKAWVAKQPAVQQKLMQAMMPRVMQGMPEVQRIAGEYLRQRAAAKASPSVVTP